MPSGRFMYSNKVFFLQPIDLNAKDRRGRTAFHLACANDQFEVAKMLVQNSLDMNIDLNAKDSDGDTAFYFAFFNCNIESKISEMIFQNSTEFKIDLIITIDGKNAFHWACSEGVLNVIERIMRKSTKFNIGKSRICYKI